MSGKSPVYFPLFPKQIRKKTDNPVALSKTVFIIKRFKIIKIKIYANMPDTVIPDDSRQIFAYASVPGSFVRGF